MEIHQIDFYSVQDCDTPRLNGVCAVCPTLLVFFQLPTAQFGSGGNNWKQAYQAYQATTEIALKDLLGPGRRRGRQTR
jgi:hypothetical protein